MRIPRLARHSAIYVVTPVAQRALYFALIPVFTRFMSPAEYGAWGYLSVVGTMLGTFGPLGLFAAYAFALRRPEGWKSSSVQVRSSALLSSILLVGATCAVAFPFVRKVDLGIGSGDLVWLVVLLATLVGFVGQAAKRRFQMLEQPARFAWLELGAGIMTALFSLIAVVVWHWGVMGLAAGLLAGAAVVFAPALRSLSADLSGGIDRQAFGEAFAYGFPLLFHAGAAILLQYVDRFMLERLSTLHELGLYSLAGQLATAMTIITTSTNQAYMPFLYRHYDDRRALIARAQAYVALFFAAAGVVGVLVTPWFIRRFVDPAFAGSVFSTQLLLIGGIFHGFYYLMLGRLLVQKRTTTAALVTAGATALNILLNLRLIPALAAEGAAWATLAAEFALFAGMWFFARGSLASGSTADDDRLTTAI
jgi:O-antigen/teichoic acid export membrane protein